MNDIVKPMSVARAEFIDGLTKLIRNCGLPPFVIEPILRDASKDISILSKQQLEIETKQYKEMLEKMVKGEEEN